MGLQYLVENLRWASDIGSRATAAPQKAIVVFSDSWFSFAIPRYQWGMPQQWARFPDASEASAHVPFTSILSGLASSFARY